MTRIGWICILVLLGACSEDRLTQSPNLEPQGDGTQDPNGDSPVATFQPPPVDQLVPDTCQTGAVMGRLCIPGSDDALDAALVYLWATDCHGEQDVYQALSTANGHFSLVGVPAGQYTVHVEKGDFAYEFEAEVFAGEVKIVDATDPDGPLCLEETDPRLAVIGGANDSVEVILTNMGLAYDFYDSVTSAPSASMQLLTDLEAMGQYDVIFFNCGTVLRDFLSYTGSSDTLEGGGFDYTTQVYQNIRTFVQHGGSVYVSDWAYPIVEGINPGVIDFHGDDDNAAHVLSGQIATIDADVTNNELELFLADPLVEIDYDLIAWSIVDDVSPLATIYVRGDAISISGDDLTNTPYMMSFRPFPNSGLVLFTTFHYHAQPGQQMIDTLSFLIAQL